LSELGKDSVIDLFVEHLAEENLKPALKTVPISIFVPDLGPLEAVIKFLKDSLGLRNSQIALLLSKSPQSVWLSYRNANSKHPQKLPVISSNFDLPFSALETKGCSVLENVVSFLRDKHMLRFSEIAKLLKRDPRTIWTTYARQKSRRDDGQG
jgi:hypothetical protein